MDDEEISAEIERIWQETGPPPKEEVEAVHKALAAQFAHWLEAPSFRAGFPHLLGRRSRITHTAARLLTRETPETLAGVMNKIRPGRLTVALRRRKLPYEVTTEAAERVQAAAMVAMMAMNVTEFDDLVGELADLIECALEGGRPNDTDWVDAFDALWRVEVEAPGTGRKYNKDARPAQGPERPQKVEARPTGGHRLAWAYQDVGDRASSRTARTTCGRGKISPPPPARFNHGRHPAYRPDQKSVGAEVVEREGSTPRLRRCPADRGKLTSSLSQSAALDLRSDGARCFKFIVLKACESPQ